MALRRVEAKATSVLDAKPCVLLVEDEPLLKKLVGGLLEEAGYKHVTIAHHNEIAAAIERFHPKCVILDSEPPAKGRGRSWADAAAIRRAHPQLPVLMFTADPDSMAEARAKTTRRSRAADYSGVIDKPFLVLEFLATLKHAVDTPLRQASPNGKGLSAESMTVFPELAGPASAAWDRADFFSTALHELRTPLTSIIGQAQLARRFLEKDQARAGEALDRTLEQATRMNRLMSELLKSTRVAIGAVSLEVVTFDLGVAVAITISQHEHEDKPRITFAHPETVRVRADPDRVAQIVGNLLDNALKYSAPGSPIEVSMKVVDREALLTVRDHGLGVPADESDRLFTPFFRTSRTRDLPGTGLGLHISKRLAEQHGGRLWLETSTDAGSVFAVALPVADPTAQPAG
ncbi:MAG: ATP-binding protein [Chloroflexota bacterium]|nr:ATP-binding protein [Chloroflexota bacterium]